jgi:hypothetical protein
MVFCPKIVCCQEMTKGMEHWKDNYTTWEHKLERVSKNERNLIILEPRSPPC